MDIFQYLEEMQEDVFSLAVEQIEAKYYDICCMLASTEYAERIKVIDVESYKVSIRVGLDAAVEMATMKKQKRFILSMTLITSGLVSFIFVRSMLHLKKRMMIGLLNGHMMLRDRSL